MGPSPSIYRLLLQHGQRFLVYPGGFETPEQRQLHVVWSWSPARHGIRYIAPLLRTPDGVDLSCYLLPQTKETLEGRYSNAVIDDELEQLTPAAGEARATVIVFHGNSMHNWDTIQWGTKFYRMGCNVLLLSYRGYSASSGYPSETGLKKDAQTALDYILTQPYLAQVPIILWGHSLGGGVAIDLASRNPSTISGIIVSCTFSSIPDIISTWPIVGPFSFFCTQKWYSAKKVRLIPATTPVLMLSGRSDEVVPPQLMDKLWAEAQVRGKKVKRKALSAYLKGGENSGSEHSTKGSEENAIKADDEEMTLNDVFVSIDAGRHNTTPELTKYWDAIRDFLEAKKWQPMLPPMQPERSKLKSRSPFNQTLGDRRWRLVRGSLVVTDGAATAVENASVGL